MVKATPEVLNKITHCPYRKIILGFVICANESTPGPCSLIIQENKCSTLNPPSDDKQEG